MLIHALLIFGNMGWGVLLHFWKLMIVGSLRNPDGDWRMTTESDVNVTAQAQTKNSIVLSSTT